MSDERFTREELYEIEKTLDVMAGWRADAMHKKISTAIHCGIDEKFKPYNDILDEQILDVRRGDKILKAIRDKCEKMRLKK